MIYNKKYIIEIGGKFKGFTQFKGISDKYQKIITVCPYVQKITAFYCFTLVY